MAEISHKRQSLDAGDTAPGARKKPKIKELPTTPAQNAAIESLVQTFRKKGQFDAIRKIVRSQFESGPATAALRKSLEELVERETDRDPSLLSRPPTMAAALIEGAGAHSQIYQPVQDAIAELIDQYMGTQGIPAMREYRVQEVGPEFAAEEENRGSKTEEEWVREADARRAEREAIREKEREKEREREREERARREERRRREREEDEAREKARQEREERRRREREEREREDEERRRQDRERAEKEREERRARQKREDEEREAEREARLKRIREEDRERERRLDLERERSRERRRSYRARSRTPVRSRGRDRDRDRERRRSRTRSSSRRSSEPNRDVKPEEIKVDDDLALQVLLRETEELKKSRQRSTLERSGSLEPPLRKPQPPKSLVPRDPVAARRATLESKPQSPMTKSPSKADGMSAASPATPRFSKDEDTVMEDAPPMGSGHTPSKSRWDQPALSQSDHKRRGRSRSRSIARSVRRRSRSHSRGSRYDRRSSYVEDRRSAKGRDDSRRRDRDDSRRRDRGRDWDDRDEKRSRHETRSPSRDRRRSVRSPSLRERRRDRHRSRSRTRSRSRDTRRRNRSPPPRNHNRSRSRSLDRIDRYIPGGGKSGGGEGPGSRRKRNDSRGRGYRSRDYDRWDGERSGRSRLQDSDRYLPGRESKDDHDKDRDRERDRDRDGGRDRDRRRHDRSRERSRDRSRDRSRSRRRSRSRSRRR